MTRTLLILAMMSAASAVPAAAQQSAAPSPSTAGRPPPPRDAKPDRLKDLLEGVVKAVVEEAQKAEQAPAASPAPAVDIPMAPETGTPPAIAPVPAAAPAPVRPPTIAAPAVRPTEAVVDTSSKPVPADDPAPRIDPAPLIAAPTVPVVRDLVPAASVETVRPEPEAVGPIAAPPENRSPVWPWLLAVLAAVGAAAAVAAGMQRARLVRTQRLLSVAPRLEPALASPSVSALSLASSPVAIRARLEMRPVHG